RDGFVSPRRGDPRRLPSFPTRRSSDLLRGNAYHEACRRWPHARDAEFHAALEPVRLEAGATLLDAPSGGGYLADHLPGGVRHLADRKSTRLNSSHVKISYAVFCLKKKK